MALSNSGEMRWATWRARVRAYRPPGPAWGERSHHLWNQASEPPTAKPTGLDGRAPGGGRMARWRAVSSSSIGSSAERPLAVARGGRLRHNRGPQWWLGRGQARRCQHEAPRPVGGSERAKLYDVLSEKAPRCTVGSQLPK